MFITFTIGVRHASHSDDLGVHLVVAAGTPAPRLPDRTRKVRLLASPNVRRGWTDDELGTRQGPLGAQNGPHAGKNGTYARHDGPGQKRQRLVRSGLERQPRLRRLSLGDAEAPRRGAARVQGISRAAALR